MALLFVLSVLAATLLVFLFLRLKPGQQQIQSHRLNILRTTHAELRMGDSIILSFDTVRHRLTAFRSDQSIFHTGAHNLIWVARSDSLIQQHYARQKAWRVAQEMCDSTALRLRRIRHMREELAYYFHSHTVQDEGYNQLAQTDIRLRREEKHLDLILKRLQSSLRDSLRLRLSTVSAYAFQGASVLPQDTVEGAIALALPTSDTTALAPRVARKLALRQHKAQRISTLPGRPMQGGRYEGMVDNQGLPHGEGLLRLSDGTFYHGIWRHGQRHGFGFELSATQGLRLGEWDEDHFRGERLLYTTGRIYGIDISRHQHEKGRRRYGIDWKRLRIISLGTLSDKRVHGSVDYPVSFVYIKATEGKSIHNPYFVADARAARRQGVRTGAYHFFSLKTPGSEQARHFLKHYRQARTSLPPVLDLEPSEAAIRRTGAQVMWREVRTWLKMIERATGQRPLLYVSQLFIKRHLDQAPDIKQDYNLWVARYGDFKPDVRLTLWQLCPDGRVRGIHGDVDINVWNGSLEGFQQWGR
ncbi:MAG: GH25 family lysozyme [Bacteroidaceae bacterium]|nr:GH25 family lysozyme [Bacteroidaceae bacterium]